MAQYFGDVFFLDGEVVDLLSASCQRISIVLGQVLGGMQVSDLGASVFNAIEFLAQFYRDTSRLLTTVEDRLLSAGLASIYGSATFWQTSQTYHSPSGWMPRWLARSYSLKSPDSSKGSEKAPWALFFNVYLTPKHLREPVAVWGLAAQPSDKGLWKPLSRLLIADDGPDFLREVPVENWRTPAEMPKRLSDFQYQATAVVELRDAQTVDELVIAPLLAQVERLRQSS